MTDPLDCTAHHEAAHAVIQYRTSGFVGGETTIVPNAETHMLGSSSDGVSDSFSEEHMRARVLSCYAGGHADRKLGSYHETQCVSDEEIAADLLRLYGWEGLESELRDQSRALVEQHWPEIVAVAKELVQVSTLDDTEVETIADIAAGVIGVSIADLERYRQLKGSLHPQPPPARNT